ncbi:MAG TPA: hypothetical protein VF042_05530 [Gemmatimonadaceae bacterium]
MRRAFLLPAMLIAIRLPAQSQDSAQFTLLNEFKRADSSLEGLRFRASTKVEGIAPAKVATRVLISNPTANLKRVTESDCNFRVRGFRTEARKEPAAWRSELSALRWNKSDTFEICSLMSKTHLIRPGDSISIGSSNTTYEMLGDSLPEGQYHFSATFGINDSTITLDAGSADVKLSLDPTPKSRLIDGIEYSAELTRKNPPGDDLDSLALALTIANRTDAVKQLESFGNGCASLFGLRDRSDRDTLYLTRAHSDWFVRCPLTIPHITLGPHESTTLRATFAAPIERMFYLAAFAAYATNTRSDQIDLDLAIDEHGAAARKKGYWDAHTHLSFYGPAALDSLAAYNVVAVRDLGANKLEEILSWRKEISEGKRKGPRIYTAGVILDGPKEDSINRWVIRTEAEAVHAVDSLAKRGVDFIKTHNGLSPPVYFAILRTAKAHHLKVASHIPRGVPAWVAADSGAASIEHAAESMLASPIYAGYVKTPQEAMAWWKSAAGDSAIAQLKKSGTYFTPTLAFYSANISLPKDPNARSDRMRAMPFLMELTGRMCRAGIPIMAGTDIAIPRGDYRPGQALLLEMSMLRRARLDERDVVRAASTNIEDWLKKP